MLPVLAVAALGERRGGEQNTDRGGCGPPDPARS